jgi:hypothetical protein
MLLGEIIKGFTQAREAADKASRDVANRYLGDDLLRGFPTPRMTVQNADLDLVFKVVDRKDISYMITLPSTQQVIYETISHALHDLMNQADDAKLVEGFKAVKRDWAASQKSFMDSLSAGAVASEGSRDSFAAILQMILLNFFHSQEKKASSGDGFLHDLFHRGGDRASQTPGDPTFAIPSALRDWIKVTVQSILAEVLPDPQSDDIQDLEIHIGGSQLEHTPTDALQRLKLTLTSQDRKWVASGSDDDKTYILDR